MVVIQETTATEVDLRTSDGIRTINKIPNSDYNAENEFIFQVGADRAGTPVAEFSSLQAALKELRNRIGTTDTDGNTTSDTMVLDEIRNPEGQLRQVAGGSSDGTSTGGAIVGTEDPLAGLNAVSPGLDLQPSGNGGSELDDVGDSTTGRVHTMGMGTGDGDVNLRDVLLVVVGVGAALWALTEVMR